MDLSRHFRIWGIALIANPLFVGTCVAQQTTAASSAMPAHSAATQNTQSPEQFSLPAQQAPTATQQHAAPASVASATTNGTPGSRKPAQDEELGGAETVEVIHIIVGRSIFIDTPERLRQVYISNPAVLDSVTPSPREVVLTAKSTGTSSVALWSETGTSHVYTVFVDVDVDGLRNSLLQALPGDQVQVTSQQGKVFLTGVVGSDAAADQAARLAGVYSKEIVNSLVVDPRHLPQIELKVHFAELDRSKLTQFGINLLSVGKNSASATTGQFSPPSFPQVGGNSTSAMVSDVLNLFYFNTPNGLGITVKDLQTKGILEILAEPTLMTLHGVPAKFLAGGEFPYPIIQPGSAGGTATVTIQFRPYGVKLEFTPYVNSDGSIRLKVAPEVSALDYSNVVVIAGYTLPSLSTRKAETEIELRDGQSFGISGILDHRTTDNLSKIPGAADIPILGPLFRSKTLNSSTSELVVVVTPTVVDPLNNSGAAPPPDPNWLVPPGNLGNFNHELPKSYEKK